VRVLERGYAVVRAADGQVVRDAADVRPGDEIDVQVATGRFAATVGDR
jgi:exodeoxyribonuclease VII large subunit